MDAAIALGYTQLARSYIATKEWQFLGAWVTQEPIQAHAIGAVATQWGWAGVLYATGHCGWDVLLDLGWEQGEVNDVLAMLEMLEGYRAAGVDHAELQLRLGDYMKYATRRCFGKRGKYPSLYSLRHQFSADAKGSGFTKAEVAALLGHGSDATAGTHYARGVSGESAVRVAPVASQVLSVRAKAKTFQPKPKPPAAGD